MEIQATCLNCNQPTTRKDQFCSDLCQRLGTGDFTLQEMATVEQAAALFSVPVATINERLASGAIKCHRAFGITLVLRSPDFTAVQPVQPNNLKVFIANLFR